MLARCFLPATLLLGCASSALPYARPPIAAASPPVAAIAAPAPLPSSHRARHLARLAPPFAAAGGTRHVAGGEAPTALVSNTP
jgi:hypothetical protein